MIYEETLMGLPILVRTLKLCKMHQKEFIIHNLSSLEPSV